MLQADMYYNQSKLVGADLHNHFRTSSWVKDNDLQKAALKATQAKNLGNGAVIGLINCEDARYEDTIDRAIKRHETLVHQLGGNAVYLPQINNCMVVKGQQVPTESEIAIETVSDPVLVRTCLDILTDAGLITSSDPDSHSRSLTVSPDKLSVGDIAVAFRSKQYRSRVEAKGLNINGEVQFLETLRNAARIVDPKLPVRQWTLADILYGLNKTLSTASKED